MTKFNIEFELQRLEHWINQFLIKYADIILEKTSNVWQEYVSNLARYNEIKIEYRLSRIEDY